MAYMNRSRDGYSVEDIYKINEYSFGVVLYRGVSASHPWMWASSYDFKTGIWGQGHYDCDTKAEAVRWLKKAYPEAHKVKSLSNYVRIIDDYADNYGVFALDNKREIYKKLYRLAKRKAIMNTKFYVETIDGKRLAKVYYSDEYQNVVSYGRNGNFKVPYRIYANGDTKRIIRRD